jgi:monoamine oxidase
VSEGRVVVRGLAHGSQPFEVTADAGVLAVPLLHARGLLSGTGPPAWSAPAIELLDRLAQGYAAKLHVPLLPSAAGEPQRPAPSATFDVPGRWWCWTALDPDPVPVVHGFGGSVEALAALDVAGGPAGWASALARTRPDLAPDLDRAMVTDWGADPWSLGAYSYPVAGAWPAGEPLEPDREARVLRRLVLAGEWTAGPWSGLMEGALRTGERAAADVLTLL